MHTRKKKTNGAVPATFIAPILPEYNISPKRRRLGSFRPLSRDHIIRCKQSLMNATIAAYSIDDPTDDAMKVCANGTVVVDGGESDLITPSPIDSPR
mmetsp:Transcript_368/g.470  ORF Transcript_368/g.470 Transcript_368/m.470 type:complete len:97 (-) Transcript_368:672-962(-)